MDGFFLVKKEKGISSNGVVQGIKRKFSFNKVGHLGTLDPMATGLLIIAVNKATKFSSYFLNEIKTYSAGVTLGSSSDTDDAEGNIVLVSDDLPETERVILALNSFLGKSLQQAPFYSALKHKGKPLYKYAREGELITKPPRDITVIDISHIDYQKPLLSFDITCSKGTYIRAIARDIGNLLSCGGHLSKLERIQQGCFKIDAAKFIKDIPIEEMISIENAFPELNHIELNELETKVYQNGGRVESIKGHEEISKIYSYSKKFIGLGKIDESGLKLKQLV
jgi:tRNA pseudouridine55 synthase|tara:strand:+ start:5234 stop:6073 length:840 start_codon:yes stop_codon:yes gene_type:complete